MLISILIPTFQRPGQLSEALASLAQQDRSLIGEVVVGDDSPPADRAANREVIAKSQVAPLVRYLPNDTPLGNYPNQCALGEQARFDHILILHDDDHLCPGGLALLARACADETDPRVKVWFGRIEIMNAAGVVDHELTQDDAKRFGKDGAAGVKPVWEWCLTQSLPPNSALLGRETYQALMRGDRDGNAGDWALHVRLANSGAFGRFIGKTVSRYRVQAVSVTGSGRGVDVHYMYEMARQLQVPPGRAREKQVVVGKFATVAVHRYLREGERARAWRCFAEDWTASERLSMQGLRVLLMFALPPRVLRVILKRKASMSAKANAVVATAAVQPRLN